MNKCFFILLLITVGYNNSTFSQIKTNNTDSVDIILSSSLSDSAKANTLFKIISEEISSKNYESAKAHSKKALNYFEKKNDVLSTIKLSEPYGNIYVRLKDYDSAIYIYKNSIDLASRLQDNEKKAAHAKFYFRLGKVFERVSYDSAIIYYEKSHEYYLSFRNNHTDSIQHTEGYSMLGYSYLIIGNAKKGYEIAEQAAKMADALKDNPMKSQSYAVLGTILNELNLFDKAVSILHIAAEAGIAANDSTKAGQSYNSIALVYLKQNKFPDALKYYYKALEYINKETASFQYVTISYNIVNLLCEMDSLEMAEHFLKNLEENKPIIKTEQGYFDVMLSFCVFYIEKGNLLKADEYMDKATEMLPSFDSHHHRMDYYMTKSDLFKARGDYKQSLYFFQLNQLYKDSISTMETKEMIAEKNTLYETEKKEKQIILLEKDNEIKTANELRAKQMRNFSFAGIAALVLILVFGTAYFIQRQKTATQKEEIEKQKAVIDERNRIASDMHDDLGAGLSTIKMMGEMAMSKPSGNDRNEIQQITQSAGELIDSMRAIVWSISSRNDTLEDLLLYLRKYSMEYLDAHGMECKMDLPAAIPQVKLTAEQRRNIFLVAKESLHNIIKHAKATSVEIKIVTHPGLTLIIHDNGSGYTTEKANRFGNGLKNMQRRMESIGGTFAIENKNGTTVTCRCAFEPSEITT